MKPRANLILFIAAIAAPVVIVGGCVAKYYGYDQ